MAAIREDWDWEPESEEHQETAEQHKARIRKPRRTIIVEPLLIIYALSGFPMILLSQQYVYQQMARQVAHDHGISNYTLPDTSADPCERGEDNDTSPLANYTQEIQALSSNFQMYANVASAVPALFVTLLLGAYSDKAGRRYAILPPLVAAVARSILNVVILLLDLSVYYMLLPSFLEGLGGGYQVLFLGCFSYIADITKPEKRAFRIVIAEFCMFLSLVLTPIGVGIWIQESGYTWPFVAVLVGQSIAMIYAIFFVPETVIPEADARFFTSAHIRNTVALYTKDNGTNRRWKLDLLIVSFFVFALISLNSVTMGSLFEMNHPLCWGSDMIGIYTAVFIGVASLGGIIVSKLLKLCISDEMICFIAGIATTLGHTYTGFVRNPYMMIAVPLFFCAGMLLVPTLRAVMSKLVLAGEQGAMFGSVAFLEVVCSLIGSVILNMVYMETIEFYTGFVYWVMALITAIGSVIFGTMLFLSRRERPSYGPLLERSTDVVNVSEEDIGAEP